MPEADDPQVDDAQQELLVSGTITTTAANQPPVEVSRGMAILTSDGGEAGTVAAVVIDKAQQRVTHLLLSRQIQSLEYRLVPVGLVEQVREETVRLSVFTPVLSSLPTWHGA